MRALQVYGGLPKLWSFFSGTLNSRGISRRNRCFDSLHAILIFFKTLVMRSVHWCGFGSRIGVQGLGFGIFLPVVSRE